MTLLVETLSSLGFSRREEQIALLENLFFEGAFQPEEVWNSLHRMSGLREGQRNDKEIRAFHTLTGALKRAGAYRNDPDAFRAEAFLQADIGNALTLEDMQDWLTYSRQSSYGRKIGTDYNQLKDDGLLDKVRERYFRNAQVMGRVDAVEAPMESAYDESWVQGASRARIVSRLDFLLEQKTKGVEIGKVSMISTASREAYSPVDGMTDRNAEERMAEGKSYLTDLAARIRPDLDNPVFTHVFSKDGSGEIIGERLDVEPPITEADIAADLLNAAKTQHPDLDAGEIGRSEDVGDNLRGDVRVTTAEAIKALVGRIRAGDFAHKMPDESGRKPIRILNVADQPFIPRMQVQVQTLANKMLKEFAKEIPELAEYAITIDTIGKSCGIGSMAFIKSDAAALARHQHERIMDEQKRARPTESLLFNYAPHRELQPPAPPARSIAALTKPAFELCLAG